MVCRKVKVLKWSSAPLQVHERSFWISTFLRFVSPGYGDCTPATTAGKIFCIFYAMFGIPVALLFLQAVGERVLNLQHKLLKRGCEVEPPYLNEKCVAMSFVFLFVLVFLGAVTQMEVEGWSFVDGFYCYVITFTTVGFGDLIPGQRDSGMFFIQPFCIILGLVVMSNVLNGLAGCTQSGAALKKLFRCDGRGKATPETDVAMTEQNSAQPKPVDAWVTSLRLRGCGQNFWSLYRSISLAVFTSREHVWMVPA